MEFVRFYQLFNWCECVRFFSIFLSSLFFAGLAHQEEDTLEAGAEAVVGKGGKFSTFLISLFTIRRKLNLEV